MVSASRRGVANALAPSYVRPSATSRSVTSLRRSSAARACMRAGISSDKNSSSRSGIRTGLEEVFARGLQQGGPRLSRAPAGFTSLLHRHRLRRRRAAPSAETGGP